VSDRRARELERAGRTGDLEAQAAALHERIRQGTLTPSRLSLAAFLGNSGARLAVPAGLCPHGPRGWCFDCRPIADSIRGLVLPEWNIDGKMGARVAIAACQVTWHILAPTHEKQNPPHRRSRRRRAEEGGNTGCEICDGLDEPRVAIVTAEAWVNCPCAWHLDAVEHSSQQLGETLHWWGFLAHTVRGAARKDGTTGARTYGLCAGVAATVEDGQEKLRKGFVNMLMAYALRDAP